MKTFFKTIGTIGSIFILIPSILLGIYGIESLFGYFPGGHFPTVAKISAQKKNVQLCNKIIRAPWLMVYGPSIADRQISCIHEYAKLTKDPSACELLMPSAYGWDCLGAAEQSNARMCWFDFGRNAKKFGDSIMPECGGQEDLIGRCCKMAKILFVEKKESCDSFRDSNVLHDQCLELLANQRKEISICDNIESSHVRSACEVAVRALLKGQ